MPELRLEYARRGRARYISHLDMMHTFQRAFSRAGLTLEYSQGFNPHARLRIALPLPVGVESECELMDVSLVDIPEEANLPELLNPMLPEGIKVCKVMDNTGKFAAIARIEYLFTLEYDRPGVEECIKILGDLFARAEVPVLRRTKRGEQESNLVQSMWHTVLSQADEGLITLKSELSAQEPTVNPALIPAAIARHAPDAAPDVWLACRKRMIWQSEVEKE